MKTAVISRADGGWRLSGTKTWSSRAAFADRVFGLFRTGPPERSSAGARHHGLTYLLFSLRAPGVTVRPIRQLSGEAGFAEIFVDEVFVPDCDVVGEPGVIAGDASTPVADAFELGTLACAAQLLGAGRALLAASVRHAGTRAQFGRPAARWPGPGARPPGTASASWPSSPRRARFDEPHR